MDSEVDSSLPSLTTPDSDQTGSNTSKRGRSAHTTWVHTRTARDGENSRHKYCIHCTVLSPYNTSVSTNMRQHLKSRHGIIVERAPGPIQAKAVHPLQQLYIQAESSGQADKIDTQVFRKHLDQEAIDKALVALIVVRNLPFRIVEWPEFHTFCQVLNPESTDFITTAHSQVVKKIEQSWQAQKDIVRKKLQSALSSIHLSLNIWTSPNRLLLGICAHFVDRSQENHSKALLALRTVVNHSGDEQFATLLPVLQDYGIVQKLGSIVCDDASSNDTLCRIIGVHLQKQEKIKWDPIYQRLRCTGHIINLAVQAFLFQDLIKMEQLESYDEQEGKGEVGDEVEKRVTFRTMGPLGKLHNIVVYIRSSSGRTKEFEDLAGRIIPLDNRTRWNSWYQMLAVANQKAGAIDTYTKTHFATLQIEYLSPEDWKRLRMIQMFLQPFHRATLETQGDHATIDRVVFTMDVLVQYFKKALSDHASNEEFCSRIKKGWETFDKYYSKTDGSPLYAAALILHPSRRTKYIRANWKTKWQKPIFKKVKELWESYREKAPSPIISLSYEKKPQDQDLDEFDRIARDLRKYIQPASQDEYEDYSNGKPYDIGKMSALEWWCQDQQRRRWPRLSYMAIDILSIPAMSDEPERIFSGARRTVSWERAQMGAETLEKVECSKHWKRSGISDEILEIES